MVDEDLDDVLFVRDDMVDEILDEETPHERAMRVARSADGSEAQRQLGAQRLRIRQEPSGLRHYLQERGVHAGARLELVLVDGTVKPGRYEWSYREGDAPMFFLDELAELGGWGIGCLVLPDFARLRWPEAS